MRRTIAPTVIAALATVALHVSPAAAQAPATCPDADTVATPTNLPQLGAATLCLLNAERTTRGLTALRENPLLTQASQAYSEQMVGQQFFAHITPDGVNLAQRLRSVGYVTGAAFVVGENLAWGIGGQSTPAGIVLGWMNSPSHRDNVLRPDFREIGIGVVFGLPVVPAVPTVPATATYTTDFGVLPPANKPLHILHTHKTKARKSCRTRAKGKGRIARKCRVRQHR
jgi:uncharacterized protein YkwD